MKESVKIKRSRKCSKCSICDNNKNVKILSVATKKGIISITLCRDCREEMMLKFEDEVIEEFERSSLKEEFDLMGR